MTSSVLEKANDKPHLKSRKITLHLPSQVYRHDMKSSTIIILFIPSDAPEETGGISTAFHRLRVLSNWEHQQVVKRECDEIVFNITEMLFDETGPFGRWSGASNSSSANQNARCHQNVKKALTIFSRPLSTNPR